MSKFCGHCKHEMHWSEALDAWVHIDTGRTVCKTEADGGVCLKCRLRAFFVSGEWWCTHQHK
jgi:hypothetical protein